MKKVRNEALLGNPLAVKGFSDVKPWLWYPIAIFSQQPMHRPMCENRASSNKKNWIQRTRKDWYPLSKLSLVFSFLFSIQNQNLFLLRILIMTNSIRTISIWVNRKFKTSGCLFWREKIVARKTTGSVWPAQSCFGQSLYKILKIISI